MIKTEKINRIIFIISLCILTTLSWLPVLSVPFINDDFQILGFHLNKNFLTAFEPFWQKDISQYYWRPLGNLLHPFMLITFGFNALPFRILSLLLNIFCGVTLYKVLSKFKISDSVSMIISVLFCLLPSHEFQYTWIADQGEILLAILLLFSFYNYSSLFIKNERKEFLIYSIVLFLAAALVKETAYAGILIPWLGFINSDKTWRVELKRTLLNTFYFALVILTLVLYRVLVIGSSPLESNHFASINPVSMIINFIIYFFLVFFPPEVLEWLQYNAKNFFVIIPISVVTILLIIFVVRIFIKLPVNRKKIFFIGIAWFIIFILPAVPVLMRWYGFTASIGIMISLAVIAEAIIEKLKWKRILYYLVAFIFIILCFINFNKMQYWKAAGDKLKFALGELSKEKTKSTILIWAIPDKLNRIPMMKLGVRETVQWALNDNNVQVFAPLRVELIGNEPGIQLNSASTTELQFEANGARFMKEGGKSKFILENEIERYRYEGNEYEIITSFDKNKLYSKVKIRLNQKPDTNFDQFYFDGEKFVRLEMK
ncbi:MAG: hypothetical protein C4539_08870 [Ignavibacteriales bacterium]|nr:MAG: hypothetical protein C4539_08870 [Ignavibacteriales bacterium]